jgi:hypothetical protein
VNEDRIDHLLRAHFARTAADDASAARVMAKLDRPLPRQKLRIRWPQVLLDWQFAPAWPRVATLACCAALGFVVGATNIDRLGSPFAPSSDDLAAIVFQPEDITGLRP